MNKYLRWIDAWKAREWNMDEKKLTCFAVHRWRTAMTTTMKIGKNKKHMEKYDRKSNQPINQQNCIIICQMSGLSCNCITFDSTLYTAQHCTVYTQYGYIRFWFSVFFLPAHFVYVLIANHSSMNNFQFVHQFAIIIIPINIYLLYCLLHAVAHIVLFVSRGPCIASTNSQHSIYSIYWLASCHFSPLRCLCMLLCGVWCAYRNLFFFLSSHFYHQYCFAMWQNDI